MNLLKTIAFALSISCAPVITNAKACSPFERQVFRLADQAGQFQLSTSFQKYGWSKAGPTNGWLDRWKAIRDRDNNLHLDFMRKYDFLPGDLYSLANAHRTGSYDSFYAGVERDIQSAERCE